MNITEDIVVKILGVIFVIWFVRRASRIIGGKNGIDSSKEFYQLVGLCFFMFFGAYMIIKEGARIDCNSHVYNEWYIGIIFGALLTVLHLDSAITNIAKVIDAITRMRSTKNDQPTTPNP